MYTHLCMLCNPIWSVSTSVTQFLQKASQHEALGIKISFRVRHGIGCEHGHVTEFSQLSGWRTVRIGLPASLLLCGTCVWYLYQQWKCVCGIRSGLRVNTCVCRIRSASTQIQIFHLKWINFSDPYRFLQHLFFHLLVWNRHQENKIVQFMSHGKIKWVGVDVQIINAVTWIGKYLLNHVKLWCSGITITVLMKNFRRIKNLLSYCFHVLDYLFSSISALQYLHRSFRGETCWHGRVIEVSKYLIYSKIQ